MLLYYNSPYSDIFTELTTKPLFSAIMNILLILFILNSLWIDSTTSTHTIPGIKMELILKHIYHA